MNINKIVSNGIYERVGGCYKLSFHFPHQEIRYYDCKGRPVHHYVMKTQVTYGVTKEECRDKARKVLQVERYEARVHIKHSRNNDFITSGAGGFI